MKVAEIMSELKSMGSESIKKIYLKHGMIEPLFGVKVAQLKPLEKRIKKDYKLANELFATGNADAMYLAGLIADDEKMTVTDLQRWAKNAMSRNISEYSVPWVASGNVNGFKLGLEWICSDKEHIAASGWATIANIVSRTPDAGLDLKKIKELLLKIPKSIHTAPNRVRQTMNNFVIATGSYVVPLSAEAKEIAAKIGPITINIGDTSSKVPFAPEYIHKAVLKGSLGKKKKKVKC